MNEAVTVKRALLSVSDKTGLVEFARALTGLGVEILSTGGTARLLMANGVTVTEVSAYTGFPEIMDGRLKTLHPKIHGGLLRRPGVDDATIASHGIAPIDLVVVNLYPFAATVARPDCTLANAIENIDIGGPTMLRAAAKNHAAVGVVVDSSDYTPLLSELREQQGRLSDSTRFRLAVKAFRHTADYDAAISSYLGGVTGADSDSSLPEQLSPVLRKVQDMRYGENPHQRGAFYRQPGADDDSIAMARQLQGKALSFNNVADADAALECVRLFHRPACVIVKHANPCGVAEAETLLSAYDSAFRTDPTSAFGGIIAFNRELDAQTAAAIVERQFVEVIVAPGIQASALEALGRRKNVRVLACGELRTVSGDGWDMRTVHGGLLLQDRDRDRLTEEDLRVVTKRAPTAAERADLLFAWRVAMFVKSNAIVYARQGSTVGIGAGQMSRVYSARIAAIKAADEDLEVEGSVMASDAFFPFRDGIDSAAEAGIRAVIQPGGSMRDQEVIDAADEHGMAMLFTGVRHFRH